MAVAYDSVGSADTATLVENATLTVSHTPVGTIRAALAFLAVRADSTDRAITATWGGQAMTELSESPVLKATGEIMSIYGYFYSGTDIPAGTQDVVFSSGGAALIKAAWTLGYTADADCELIDHDGTSINSDSTTVGEAGTLTLGGRACAVAVGGVSGAGAVSGMVALTGWTERGEYDLGPMTTSVFTLDTNTSSDVGFGWDQGVDDAIGIGVAFSEVASAGGVPLAVFLNANQIIG